MSMPASQLREAPPAGDLPRVMGRYVLLDRIGRGGMCEVFLAIRRGAVFRRRVAIKRARPELACHLDSERVLLSEAWFASHLSHPNLARVLESGRDTAGTMYLVIEYVEGLDLHALLARLSRSGVGLPASHAVYIVIKVLKALEHIHRVRDPDGHRLGLVHRDVSPSNVLLSLDGDVKLCDYGIASATPIDADDDALDGSPIAGKVAYMAPEHARGELVDARSDLFSAAAILWQLFAGRRLIRGTPDQMLAQARAGQVPSLPKGRPVRHLDSLQGLLDRALATDRRDRFRSATEIIEALEEYVELSGLHPSRGRFGAFLTTHFADEIVDSRDELERLAAPMLEPGPTEHSAVRVIPAIPPKRSVWPFAVGVAAGCVLAVAAAIALL